MFYPLAAMKFIMFRHSSLLASIIIIITCNAVLTQGSRKALISDQITVNFYQSVRVSGFGQSVSVYQSQ